MTMIRDIVRIGFLALAFVAYARPSFAWANWNQYCSISCNGSVRVLQCQFIDYADYNDPNSECNDDDLNQPSCCGSDQWRDPNKEAYSHYWHLCEEMAGGAGGMWFTSWSCSENPSSGSFYCSYNDQSCGG